jgi:hypothetical protein
MVEPWRATGAVLNAAAIAAFALTMVAAAVRFRVTGRLRA